MRVFIGMETSGVMRRAFAARGHDAISCDLLPAQDDGAAHIVGDVFDTLDRLRASGWWPDLAIFHPDCTFFTVSAAWAFKDPDYAKYPGVGYHQRVKPETLVGKARRDRQAEDLGRVHGLANLKIQIKIIENPIGRLSTLWTKPSDIVQPYEFGDDASKATCFWVLDESGSLVDLKFPRDPALFVSPSPRKNGTARWANQTDNGQNRLSPSENRWQQRSDTYPGIARAVASFFG